MRIPRVLIDPKLKVQPFDIPTHHLTRFRFRFRCNLSKVGFDIETSQKDQQVHGSYLFPLSFHLLHLYYIMEIWDTGRLLWPSRDLNISHPQLPHSQYGDRGGNGGPTLSYGYEYGEHNGPQSKLPSNTSFHDESLHSLTNCRDDTTSDRAE